MKSLSQIEQPHNSEIDEKFHQLNLTNIRNVIYWFKYFEKISKVPGDIVECGIGRGRSLLIIAAINTLLKKEEGGERTIFAYDSFEGFPEPTKEDESYRKPAKGDWSQSPSGKYNYTEDFIKLVLTEAGISFIHNNITLKKGFFCDTLKNHPSNPIALLHIDGDLYQSYKDTLENLFSKVAQGGIIIFDDFYENDKENERWPGARKAVEEYLGNKINKLNVNDRGTYYLIKD